MQLSDRARQALYGEPNFFFEEAGSNVGGDRRQCSACRVFRPKATLSRVERDVCQYFLQQELFKRFGRWVQWTNWASVLADVAVLAWL